jgi:hypothetical protein
MLPDHPYSPPPAAPSSPTATASRGLKPFTPGGVVRRSPGGWSRAGSRPALSRLARSTSASTWLRRRAAVGPVALACALALAAGCRGGATAGADGQQAAAPAADAGGANGSGTLAGVCPDPVVIQTSWYPESTHGGLYQLVGPGYSVDKQKQLIRGPMVIDGLDTGVDIEIRPGGPARGGQQAPQLMYQDRSITLGQTATEEQIGYSAGQPTLGVFAAMDDDPVVYIWDSEAHPTFNTLSDIGQTRTKVLSFRSPNADYLGGAGILRESQMDYSYDGSPSRFVASQGQDVVGGFSTNEVWIYEHGLPPNLRRKVSWAYVSASQYPNYRNLLAIRSADRERLAPCLKLLVPILQRGQVEFMQRPEPALKLVVQLVSDYHATYDYSPEHARWGVEVMRKDALVGNGSNKYLGDFDPARLQRMLDILVPIYVGQKRPVRQPFTPAELATNEFLDPSIGLPS